MSGLTKNEIKKALNNKFQSQFIITFVFSWLAWNWEAILYFMFFDADILIKIETLKSNYFSNKTTLILPLISSPIIILAVNLIDSLLGYVISRFMTQKVLRQQALEEDFEHDMMLHKHIEANDKYKELLNQLINHIERSNNEKISFAKSINDFRKRNSKLETGLSVHHKFESGLESILKSDLKLIEKIKDVYGLNISSYILSKQRGSVKYDLEEMLEYNDDIFDIKIKTIEF